MRTIMQTSILTVVTIVASVVALASPSGATTVTSPPLYLAGTQTLRCLYTNLEPNKTIEAARYVADAPGDHNYEATVTILPGQTAGANHPSAFGVVRCVLDGKFRRRRIAVTACALSGDVTETCVSTGP